MTGPEHYKAAEECLAGDAGDSATYSEALARLAEAQVHATLALAAATALQAAWVEAASETEKHNGDGVTP
jgi:hypothetical protein